MIYIITGEINSGKTTRILELFKRSETNTGDGFISKKVFQGEKFLEYEIERLSNGEKRTLALLKEQYNGEFLEEFQFAQFIFSVEGFKFGEEIIHELLTNKSIKNIYIDEIGPIELQGKGFYSILKKVLSSSINIYICIRNNCLEEVLEKFKITSYEII